MKDKNEIIGSNKYFPFIKKIRAFKALILKKLDIIYLKLQELDKNQVFLLELMKSVDDSLKQENDFLNQLLQQQNQRNLEILQQNQRLLEVFTEIQTEDMIVFSTDPFYRNNQKNLNLVTFFWLLIPVQAILGSGFF